MKDFTFSKNEVVFDDLTGKKVTILDAFTDKSGNVGYRVDSEYLLGGRLPWELTKLSNEPAQGAGNE
jgi:hypothetical protein